MSFHGISFISERFKLLFIMFQAYHTDQQVARCHYHTLSCIKFHLNEQTVKIFIKRILIILQL